MAQPFDIQFTWQKEPVGPQPCPYADQFQRWCDDLGRQLIYGGNVIMLNQAKIMLVDRFMDWRATVPKAHRNNTGTGHICIWHVFEGMYQKIRAAELSINPPILYLPDPIEEDQLERVLEPEIHGIALGEIKIR